MSTIPISSIVGMVPGVIGGGGAPSRLTGIVLSHDSSLAPGQLQSFYLDSAVDNWFGIGSNEAILADNYFPGIVNGGQLPYVLQYAYYATAATPAGSYGAPLGSLTLAQLQALSGTLIVTVDGTLFTSSSINLSTATNFANAATEMLAAFTAPTFTITYDAQRNRFLLMSTLTGTAATCSDVTGTLAAAVGLESTAGAFIQAAGIAADTPASAMNRVISLSTNWGTFTTSWQAVIADRLSFAQWNSGQNYNYLYVGWDMDGMDLTPTNAATFGAQVLAAPYQGTLPLYGTQAQAGAIMGYAASINYNVTNGRTNLAFRQFNAGTPATVSSLANAQALLTNGYTYIGAYANSANNYTIAYAGQVSGAFLWVDTYLDQIYLNKELQLATWAAMLAFNSLPYNVDGYTALYRAGVDVIDAAVTSGIIRAGVVLSQSQQQQINTAAGLPIADVVQTRGWYYQVGNPANIAQARTTRTSPTCKLWWTDGGSIQSLTIGSIAVL